MSILIFVVFISISSFSELMKEYIIICKYFKTSKLIYNNLGCWFYIYIIVPLKSLLVTLCKYLGLLQTVFILLKLQIWRSVTALQEIIVFKNTKTILKPSCIRYIFITFETGVRIRYSITSRIRWSKNRNISRIIRQKETFYLQCFRIFFNDKCAWLSENLTLQKHTALGPNENIHLVICVQMWAQGRI